VQGGAAYPGVSADGSDGLNVTGALTIGSGTASQLRTTCAYIGAGSPALPLASAVPAGTYMQVCDAATPADLVTGGGSVQKWIYSDGAAWLNAPSPMTASSPLSWNSSTLTISCPTCSITVGSGTASLGTSEIAAGACASVVTVAASGVASTDVVLASFNSDPSGDTGYVPGASLDIRPYPTTNNVNFKVCNGTGEAITPSARTLNWRVVR
jgi:hypothetical protein